ncbi:MAG: hypothetical protein C4294_10255, partial [Nitrospiraceae bacterium]
RLVGKGGAPGNAAESLGVINEIAAEGTSRCQECGQPCDAREPEKLLRRLAATPGKAMSRC